MSYQATLLAGWKSAKDVILMLSSTEACILQWRGWTHKEKAVHLRLKAYLPKIGAWTHTFIVSPLLLLHWTKVSSDTDFSNDTIFISQVIFIGQGSTGNSKQMTNKSQISYKSTIFSE